MGGARKFSVLLLALACASALAACGGGSSTATTATGTAQPATTAAAGTGGGSGGGSKESQNGGGSESGKSSQGGSGGGETGSSHERSSSFRTPGGDNSIQEYGDEVGAEERAKATKTITTFFVAAKDKEWAKVCGVLAAKTVAQVEELTKRVPKLKAKSCAGAIGLVFSSAPSQARPETIKGPVISLRREGGQAFALYHGIDGKNYAFPLTLENGEWKMTSMGATPLSF